MLEVIDLCEGIVGVVHRETFNLHTWYIASCSFQARFITQEALSSYSLCDFPAARMNGHMIYQYLKLPTSFGARNIHTTTVHQQNTH